MHVPRSDSGYVTYDLKSGQVSDLIQFHDLAISYDLIGFRQESWTCPQKLSRFETLGEHASQLVTHTSDE
jgi:hypothetical protein